jgi:hypothetical protein
MPLVYRGLGDMPQTAGSSLSSNGRTYLLGGTAGLRARDWFVELETASVVGNLWCGQLQAFADRS